MSTQKNSRITDWALRLIPAAILAMAIPAKFIADPGAVAIFSQLEAEPFGRVATGIFESLAVILLLVPRTTIYGALLAAGLMSGAILAHLTVLGLALQGDPSMSIMAVTAFATSVSLAWRRRLEIPLVSQFVRPDPASVA